jgi:hypothetical protein
MEMFILIQVHAKINKNKDIILGSTFVLQDGFMPQLICCPI